MADPHGWECIRRYGGDVGLTERVQGWLGERGLAVFQLDPDLAARSRHWAWHS
ncbi:hypothetical protein AB0H83_39570 [Dactylosporangium sp. NPDC050688]|uniref:hypothetical protein n=1 Tax=Dactylosporangium sp. NPDC050688 TaxID=3157217 RepID=UPI00340287F3